MKRLYLFLAVFGFVLPYYFLGLFLVENGLDPQLLVNQLFANNISTFFAVDLIVTAVVLLAFVYRESLRYGMGNWWAYAIATLVVGPSFAFPLFLYARESRIQAAPPETGG
jgi:hypothetical protein